MRRPGLEPGFRRWQRLVITTTLSAQCALQCGNSNNLSISKWGTTEHHLSGRNQNNLMISDYHWPQISPIRVWMQNMKHNCADQPVDLPVCSLLMWNQNLKKTWKPCTFWLNKMKVCLPPFMPNKFLSINERIDSVSEILKATTGFFKYNRSI